MALGVGLPLQHDEKIGQLAVEQGLIHKVVRLLQAAVFGLRDRIARSAFLLIPLSGLISFDADACVSIASDLFLIVRSTLICHVLGHHSVSLSSSSPISAPAGT